MITATHAVFPQSPQSTSGEGQAVTAKKAVLQKLAYLGHLHFATDSRMHSAPEEVERKQQDQSNQYLVPKGDDRRTVKAPGLPASLRKMQVVWRVHEFQGDEGAWFIGHLKQYLANSGLELPIGPFLCSEKTLSMFQTWNRRSGRRICSYMGRTELQRKPGTILHKIQRIVKASAML